VVQAPAVVAHPTSDGTCATLYRDVERTAASVGAFAEADATPGDGSARTGWTSRPDFIGFLMRPFPPVRPTLRMLRALGGVKEILDFARLGVMPLRRHAEEEFEGAGAARPPCRQRLHADVTPDSAGSALYGWVLVRHRAVARLARPPRRRAEDHRRARLRLRSKGGEIVCGDAVTDIVVPGGRAVGVRTAGGTSTAPSARSWPTRRAGALRAGCSPRRTASSSSASSSTTRRSRSTGRSTGPIPWIHEDARRAGTVHVTEGLDALSDHAAELNKGVLPSSRSSCSASTRATTPAACPRPGKEVAWAYTHIPNGIWREEDTGDRSPTSWRSRSSASRRASARSSASAT
jgi:phytoene dehydrogenase-like protein